MNFCSMKPTTRLIHEAGVNANKNAYKFGECWLNQSVAYYNGYDRGFLDGEKRAILMLKTGKIRLEDFKEEDLL